MKINYGIYLGLTSASIAKMENGVPLILISKTLKERMPVSVHFNRKGGVQIGDAALNAHKHEIKNNERDWENNSINSFTEFGRTIGTDMLYPSTNANQSFSSTELVAEIIKGLLSFEKETQINAAVITIPDTFNINQINAIREAGELAGLDQVEVVQESLASAMAFGLDSVKFQGFSLVFAFDDFFYVSLIKNGFIIDNESDYYLSDKNLDIAIVDEIILPYIKDNFVIDSILADDTKNKNLRNSLRYYAEDTKKKLTFNETHGILTNFGDIPGEDDNGDQLELDITVTQADITKALSPVFQKAIDISKSLLERNNLKGSVLDSLALVGGPTFSPVLRRLIEEQICKPTTSIDPKTAIVIGAALYASSIDLSNKARVAVNDTTKIQLEIEFKSMSSEIEEFITIKISETEAIKKVFAEVTRGDKAWSSGKVEIDAVGEVIVVQLNEKQTNYFEVVLFDNNGTRLECEPDNFSIIQDKINRASALPYNIGTEIKDEKTGNLIFRTFKGLEKNQSIPATGTYNGIKTKFPIRPRVESDFIKIPIYEGGSDSEGSRAIYNEHVCTIIISGADLPTLLPENSDIDLIICVDKSQRIVVTAYFPYLNFSTDIQVEMTYATIDAFWLDNEIQKAKESIAELKQDGISDNSQLQKIENELENLEKSFEENKKDVDCKQQVLTNLRKSLKAIDELNEATEWPKLEDALKKEFYKLEKVDADLRNDKTTQVVNQLRSQLEEVIKTKDLKLGNVLVDEIKGLSLTIGGNSIEKVEDFLFELTQNEILSSTEFQSYFEQLSKLKNESDVEVLQSIFNQLKEYELKS